MYANFVSLGSACPVASSMTKCGLRSWAGPFDWLITNRLDCVLGFMQNEFADFIHKDSLVVHNDKLKGLWDRRTGFWFLHEQSDASGYHYDRMKLKYQKRIDRFLRETEKQTCFLRSVNSKEEIDYIIKNYSYINDVIKHGNSQNEIVFLLDKGLPSDVDLPFRWYTMKNEFSGESRELLRGWFDDADDFLTFCVNNYDPAQMMKNIAFDWRNGEQKIRIVQGRYDTLLKMLEFDFNKLQLPEEIIIYGAGNIGRLFYEKIRGRCVVRCFADQYKADQDIDGIPILNLDKIEWEGAKIIVTAIYNYEEICQDIYKRDRNAAIMSLNEIMK